MNDLTPSTPPDAIGRITADGRVYGEGLPPLSDDQKKVLRKSKPTAHKLGGMVVCAAPVTDGSVLLHCYIALPPGLKLSEAIAQVERAASATDAKPTGPRADPIAKAFAATFDLPDKIKPAQFLAALSDVGFRGVVAMAAITNGGMRHLWFQRQEYEQTREAMTQVLQAALKDDHADLDLALLAKSLGGRRLDVLLPGGRDKAIALVALDLDPEQRQQLEDKMVFLAPLNADRPAKARAKGRGKLIALAALVLALIAYLAWPAPIYVNNFATTRATRADVVALPFGAFLEDVMVRAGEIVRPGQTLVHLRSPSIEDSLSEQAIQRQLEEINAQEAIETGRVAEFQLAKKREELATVREAQLQARARFLTVVSDREARVVSVQAQGDKGLFLAEGTPIITLQTSDGFDVIIDVNPADAALLAVGQTGNVQFRGVSSKLYPIKVLSTPVQVQDPNSPMPGLQIKARIDAENQSDLVNGLNGFAKIETGEAPRVVGLTRPLREYIRVTLWKYLGITF